MDDFTAEALRRSSQSWFENQLEDLSAEERVRAELGDAVAQRKRNITLPLEIEDQYLLDHLATLLGMSKTAVAVNMLSDALSKAYGMIRPREETPERYWENVIAFAKQSGAK